MSPFDFYLGTLEVLVYFFRGVSLPFLQILYFSPSHKAIDIVFQFSLDLDKEGLSSEWLDFYSDVIWTRIHFFSSSHRQIRVKLTSQDRESGMTKYPYFVIRADHF